MTRSEEHRQAVEAEVLSWGLRAVTEYDGKHLIVSWRLADGSKRRFTVSSTPSHWRTTLNECARIRRIMRQDGLQRPAAEPHVPRSFAKYFELPSVPQRPDSARLAALEERLGELTDLLVDLLSRGIPPQPQAAQPQQLSAKPSDLDSLPTSLREIIPFLSFDKLRKPSDIAAAARIASSAAVGQRLTRLRELGLAINIGKRGWKRQRQSQSHTINGGACHGQEAESRTGASAPRA